MMIKAVQGVGLNLVFLLLLLSCCDGLPLRGQSTFNPVQVARVFQRSVNCSVISSCGSCNAESSCVWCSGKSQDIDLRDSCISLPISVGCAFDDNDPCPTEFSQTVVIAGALVLSVLSVAASWCWWRAWKSEVTKSALLHERTSNLQPGSEAGTYHVLTGDEDEINQPLFVGSVVSPDHWARPLYRELFPTTLLLAGTTVLELATLFTAAVAGQQVYLLWSVIVLVGCYLLPGFFIVTFFYRAYTRRVHSMNFYNGKMLLLRMNGIMTEYSLDASTTHDSGPDTFFKIITCAKHMLRITISNSNWADPVTVFVLEDDKSIFLRYLSYAISEELESSRPSQSSSSSPHHGAVASQPTFTSIQKQRDWVDSGSDEDWPDRPVVDQYDEPDWLDD